MINLWEDFVVIVFFSGMLLRGFKLRTGKGCEVAKGCGHFAAGKTQGYVIMLYSSQICVLKHTYTYHNMYIIYSNYK